MLRGLKERFPKAHLKAFTAIEIGWFAKREKISIEEVLRRLRDAGLGSLPGGGAEIFHSEVREIICDGKLDAERVDRGPPHRPQDGDQEQLHHALRPRRTARAQGRPPAAPARAPGRDGRLQRLHPARLPPREQLHGAEVPHHRDGRPAPHRHLAAGARQHPAHQGLLGDDHAQAGPGGPALRGRRHGRHGRRGEDLPHGRRRHDPAAHPLGARADRARGRLRAGRARHALQPHRARRRRT